MNLYVRAILNEAAVFLICFAVILPAVAVSHWLFGSAWWAVLAMFVVFVIQRIRKEKRLGQGQGSEGAEDRTERAGC